MSDGPSVSKRILKWLAVLSAALVGLVLLLLVLAALPPGESIIKGLLEDQLSAGLSEPVSIGEFRTNIISRAGVTGVTVGPDTAKAPVRISSLTVEYSLWPLLSKRLAVRSVTIDTVVVHITRDSARGFNLSLLDSLMSDTPAGRDETDQPGEDGFTLQLGTANIGHLTARYDDRVLPARAAVRGLALRMDGTDTSGYQFDLRTDSGYVQYADSPEGTIDLRGRGHFGSRSLNLDTLALRVERLLFSARGQVALDSTAEHQLQGNLEGRVGSFLEFAQQAYNLPPITIDSAIRADVTVGGSGAAPTAEVRLALPEFSIREIPARGAYIAAGWRSDSLSLDSLMIGVFGGTVSGRGFVQPDTAMRASLKLTLSEIALEQLWSTLHGGESPYGGRLSGTLDLMADGSDWQTWKADLDLATRRTTFEGKALDDFAITVAIDNGTVDARIDQKNVQVEGTIRVDDSLVAGNIQFAAARLAPLAGLFGDYALDGALRGSATIGGGLDNPTFDAAVQGSRLNYRNFPADTLDAAVRYDGANLYVAALTVSGRYRASDPAAPLFGIDSLSGGLRYAAEVSGTLDSLDGRLELHLTEPGYAGITLDSGSAVVTVQGRQVTISRLGLYRDSLYLEAAGGFTLAGRSGRLTAQAFDLGAGRLDTVARVDTTGAGPPAYKLITDVQSAFSLPDTGAFSLSAGGRGIDLGALEDLLVDSFDVGGTLDFDLSLTGPIDSLQASVRASISRPWYEEVALDSVLIDGSFAAGTIALDSVALFGRDQRLNGTAAITLGRDSAGYALTETSRVRGSLDVSRFNLRLLEPFLWEGGELTGTSSLDLSFDGTAADPNVTGSLRLDSVRLVTAPDMDPIEDVYLNSTVRDTLFSIVEAGGRVGKTLFTVAGTATLSAFERLRTSLAVRFDTAGTVTADGLLARDELDFTARVDSLDLSLLEPFAPDITDPGGVIDGRVHLTGTAEAPEIDGRIRGRDITFGYETLPEPVTGGVINATFTRERVRLDSLYAAIGDGYFNASGTVQYADGQLQDIDVNLAAADLPVKPVADLAVLIRSADLSYRKIEDYYELGGEVELGETRYTRNFAPTEFLPWAQEVEQVEPAYPEFVQQTRMRVRLRNSDRIWFDNNLAKVRLHAEVEVLGRVAEPNLNGRVAIVEGYLLYLDRKFEVQEGVVYFNDPNRINPDITLRASTEVTTYSATEPTTYDITFAVTGKLEEPRTDLSASPPLDRPDIIALLTLGATRAQLSGGSGDDYSTGEILQNRAEVLASRQISGYVGSKVGSLLGLDEVSVQGNIFDVSDTTGPEIIASKRISDQLKLTYRTTVGHMNEQSVRLNYELSRRFSLEGQTNRRGESSLSMKYKIRFK